MMQKLLTKYWLAFQLVVLFGAVSLSIFKTEATGSVYLLWLSLFVVESLVLLPTVFKEESIADARKRVYRSLEGDAFSYVGLVLIAIIGIQWLNSGCSLIYLPDADVWKYSLPPIEWIPYSVKPLPTLAGLSLVVSVFAGVLVVRNGLGKGGKRFFLDTATIMSGMIAAYAFFQSHAGVEPYTTWAAHPGACNPGTFFVFWFLISLGLDLGPSTSRFSSAKTVLWWVFAFAGNLVGFLQFSSATSMVVYSVIGVLLIIYRIAMLVFQHVQLGKRFRLGMGILAVLVLVSGSIVFLIPKSPIISKVMELQDVSHFEKMTASRLFRTNAALKIWEEVPWTGVGVDGFAQYLGTVIEDRDWKLMKSDKRWVWNDGFQFLCEWGVIGTGVLGAMIITIVIPLFVRVRKLFGTRSSHRTAWDIFVMFDAYIVPSAVGLVMLLIEGWFSSPFQSPAVFMSWFCVLAVLPGLLPPQRVKHA